MKQYCKKNQHNHDLQLQYFRQCGEPTEEQSVGISWLGEVCGLYRYVKHLILN
jgi:hypothetical protein